MLSITKQTINSQKKELFSFAYNVFGAHFISVMNGKNRYLERANYGYTHLRFTTMFKRQKDGSFNMLDKKDYEDSYWYVTTSTTTKKAFEPGSELSDRCFNVRDEVLFAHSDHKSVYFLVDLGEYWAYVSREYARKHIVECGEYDGRKVCTIRLPVNSFVKKTTDCDWFKIYDESKCLTFDATYIQNCTYSKYRKRGGLLKVEVFKEGELQAIKYYVSTGALKEDFEQHGKKYSQEYFRLLCNKNKTIEVNGNTWRFSKCSELNDISNLSPSSFNVAPPRNPTELGYSLQSLSYLKEIDLNMEENVMINPTSGSVEEKVKDGEDRIVLDYDIPNDFDDGLLKPRISPVKTEEKPWYEYTLD